MAVLKRPPWIVARVINPIIALTGAATTLVVEGRTSGKPRIEAP